MTYKITNTSLLIAPPGMPDPRFRNAVLMLTHNNRTGSFALCLNRPTNITINDLLEDHPIECNLPMTVYWGGPVNPNTVWMLHSSEWETEHTVLIDDQWAMTSNMDMFEQMAEGILPRQFRVFAGYAGWAPGQLEQEMQGIAPRKREHSWLVADNPGPEWVMEQPEDLLWENATTLCSHQAVDSWL